MGRSETGFEQITFLIILKINDRELLSETLNRFWSANDHIAYIGIRDDIADNFLKTNIFGLYSPIQSCPVSIPALTRFSSSQWILFALQFKMIATEPEKNHSS
ncbi:MAG: hypothetical protein ABSF52_22595 [Syntrophobacteraceae bacterium]|jgi:hypothetical protein